jgi:glycosyltransferase involved in cell wall biosynthesis
MEKGLVSIVIPIVRNDPHVAGCIEAIKKSTYSNYEIIVVDAGRERSYQRNLGMDKSKGEFLLILDSDMHITKYVLEDCVYIMNHDPEVVGIYIPERIVTPGWFGRLRDWERQFYNETLVDVVRFVRAEGCPIFDETLHGVEDSDWERRMPGKKASTIFEVHHYDKCGVIKFLKKKAYYAKCLNKYKAKNPADKLLTFKYRCIQVFIENGKWKRLIKKPHYAVGVALLLFARGLIYLWARRRY